MGTHRRKEEALGDGHKLQYVGQILHLKVPKLSLRMGGTDKSPKFSDGIQINFRHKSICVVNGGIGDTEVGQIGGDNPVFFWGVIFKVVKIGLKNGLSKYLKFNFNGISLHQFTLR